MTVSNGSSGQNARLVADGILVMPAGATTSDVYDNLGELVSSTDGMARETIYQYNVLGRQTVETDPSPGNGAATPSTTRIYDALGDVLTSKDVLGDTTSYGYDGFDRLQTVTNPDEGDDQTSYTYDADGNVTSETDADQNVTSYTYNRRSTSQKSMTNDALGQTTT